MTPAARTRLLRRLCIGIMALAVAEFVVATLGVQIRRLPASTDFATYYLAGAQARDGLSPYDHEALAERGRALGLTYDQFPFLYPPPFALAMQPLAAISYPRARQIWMLVSTAALLAALACCVRLVLEMATRTGMPGSPVPWFVLAALFPSALNSTSVHNDIRGGSVGSLLFLCATAMACALLRAPDTNSGRTSRRNHVGLALALAGATLVKLVPAGWIVWVAWRGRRAAAVVAVALLALVFLPALAHWGIGIVPAYCRDALWPSLLANVSPPMNQSLDATISRFFIASRWTTPPVDAPLLGRVLSWAAMFAVAALTLRDLAAARRAAVPWLLPVEFGQLVLAMLLLMKLAWVQTLAAMLFVWPALMIVLATAAAAGLPWARRAMVVACAGYFLSSAHVPILWAGLRHGPAVAVTAVHTVGLLLLWGVCGVVLRRAAALQGCAATATRG